MRATDCEAALRTAIEIFSLTAATPEVPADQAHAPRMGWRRRWFNVCDRWRWNTARCTSQNRSTRQRPTDARRRRPSRQRPRAASNRADFAREHAEQERVKREQRELKLAIERGEYLPREAQRQAAATALAVVTQSMRSIPDNIERTLGLAPDVVDAVSIQLHAALTECVMAFKAMADG